MKRLLPLLLLAALAAPAAAQYCDTSNSCFFPPGPCAYLLSGEFVTFSNGWQLTLIDLENSIDCDPLPPLGGSTNQQNHSTGVLRLKNGGTVIGGGGNTLMTMHLFAVPPSANPREVDLELLAIDFSPTAFPAGMMLRESPTQASVGHFQQTEVTPGNYHITSFFDVFFELSLDNGQSWSPASSAAHIVLSPAPPLPAHAATWGSVKASYR